MITIAMLAFMFGLSELYIQTYIRIYFLLRFMQVENILLFIIDVVRILIKHNYYMTVWGAKRQMKFLVLLLLVCQKFLGTWKVYFLLAEQLSNMQGVSQKMDILRQFVHTPTLR